MAILREIQKWSQGLPAWQQDAIARLYHNRELEAADIDDVFALLKAEHGIEDPQKRKPSKLGEAQVAAPPVTNRLVQIAAIKNLREVNALAEGQRLPINLDGLTVIYGENGAGKSGYSRVLKHACRARDQGEQILPDARKELGKTGAAQADFEVLVDGTASGVTWVFGKEAPEQLSEIAIFDSHCARAYVDNQGDFAYAPYGLDILGGLVKVCNTLRTIATKEQAISKPNVEPFAELAKTQTKSGQLLSRLSSKTKSEVVEALTCLSDAEKERLDTLNKTLAVADPKQKAQDLRLRAARLTGLGGRIAAAIDLIGDVKVADLRALIDKSKATKQAAEIASKQFKSTPGLLAGTGGESWKTLFEAARTYAAESHAGRDFPNLGSESTCPLCQNELGPEGSARLVAFDAFVQQEAEKAAKTARAMAITAFKIIEQAKLDLAIDETLRKDFEDTLPDLAVACSGMQKSLNERRSATLKASACEVEWESIVALPADQRETIADIVTKLQAEAKTLEASMDEKAKTAMLVEQAELAARARLAEFKTLVLDSIAKFILSDKLKACIDATATTAISRKSTDLSKTMATKEVADALNAELRNLNVHELQVAMKPESPGGKTQFKLALQLPGGGSPSAILSEGEQRAIAIASFLAEVNLGKGLGGVVFDDPVSSLDHLRRERVARRFARESLSRQVIVFTHDLYFLNVLMHEARLVGSEPVCLSLRRSPAGIGVADLALPFDGASTKERVGQLRQMRVECSTLHRAGDDAGYRRAARDTYAHLRMSWERAVEELLFNGVVLRFRKGIETNRLTKVIVEDHDVATIQQNMGRCSTFTGHDGAMDALPAMPEPAEIQADIEVLETWRKATDDRAKKLKR